MDPAATSQASKLDSIELERIFSVGQINPVQFVDTILNQCIKFGASDILFEPRKQNLSVRARIDGVLYELGQVNVMTYPQVVSRIKVMSGLDPTETRKIQEGQATVNYEGKQVNLRVEIAQIVYGELIVIRIHEAKTIVMNLSELGFNQVAYKTYEMMLTQKSGLVLVSGPTGSGKTTTLYSTLAKLNEKQDQNIMTIEDPIEFQLDGINQMQVDEATHFTFAQGLRTILRLTPDVVFVGEIRDRETAKIAIESGLTGQLVFSTAHAEDSIRTLFRLMDLDVETYFLNSAIQGVVAQRLVRKICESCKIAKQPTQQEVDMFQSIVGRPPKQLIEGRGCPACNNIGYQGRIGIYEVLYVNSLVRELLRSKTNEAKMAETLKKNGFVSLLQDGLEKAEMGITTVDEVIRNSLRIN